MTVQVSYVGLEAMLNSFQVSWLRSLPERAVSCAPWLLGICGQASWRNGIRGYAQQLGKAVNLFPCSGKALELGPHWYSLLAWDPNLAELTAKFPG